MFSESRSPAATSPTLRRTWINVGEARVAIGEFERAQATIRRILEFRENTFKRDSQLGPVGVELGFAFVEACLTRVERSGLRVELGPARVELRFALVEGALARV